VTPRESLNGSSTIPAAVTLTLDPAALEALARRAAEIVREGMEGRQGFLDVAGAAEFLACKPDRIYALTSSNRIPHHKDGSRLLFDRDELREYVRNGGAKRP
jgi:excisionase family DNA binding protein